MHHAVLVVELGPDDRVGHLRRERLIVAQQGSQPPLRHPLALLLDSSSEIISNGTKNSAKVK
jgi:hypothetical protein